MSELNVTAPIPDRVEQLGTAKSGLLMGRDGSIIVATPGVDYATPEALAGKADREHSHEGLSSVVPPGQLWGGQGSGVPSPVEVGPGLEIMGGKLVSDSLQRVMADINGVRNPLFWDDFSRPNGPLGTSPSGHAWDDGGFGWSILDGQAARPDNRQNGQMNPAVVDLGTTNVEGALVLTTGSKYRGIVHLYVDPDNYLVASNGRAGTIEIIQRFGGVSTNLKSLSISSLVGAGAGHNQLEKVRMWSRVHIDPENPDRIMITARAVIYGVHLNTGLIISDPDVVAVLGGSTRHGMAANSAYDRVSSIMLKGVDT